MDELGAIWPSLTAAAGGWALFGLAGLSVIRGWLTPRWVVAMMEKRIETLEATLATAQAQNAQLLKEGLPMQNDLLRALRAAAVQIAEDDQR